MATPEPDSHDDRNDLLLEIVTPEGSAYRERAGLVELPTVSGELGIYPGHVPLFAELGTGEIRVYRNRNVDIFVVSGGYVQISPGTIRILAHFVSLGEDEARIDEACRRAQEALEMADNLSPQQIEEDLTALRAEMLRTHKRGKR